MDSTQASGFEELPHTADWALRAWALDLEGLFAESARGMIALSGAQPAAGPRLERTFRSRAHDPESLLVRFLTELVYAADEERLAFDRFKVHLNGDLLEVQMSGAPLQSLTKVIKAVTYHNLQIRATQRGFEVEIVFDV